MSLENINNFREKFIKKRKNFWDELNLKPKSVFTNFYNSLIYKSYQNKINESSSVLELGCGEGDLLSLLKPKIGYGIDFSENVINKAKKKHPNLNFIVSDVHNFKIPKFKFDYIIISELINDIWDLQIMLKNLHKYCNKKTKLIFSFHSQLWNSPIKIARIFNIIQDRQSQNWFTKKDLSNLLNISNFESLTSWSENILPVNIPFVSNLFNKYLAKLPLFNLFCITNFVLARPKIENFKKKKLTVSVIIAARNEEGHINDLISRIPNFGKSLEIIFVEGNSKDNTYEEIKRNIKKFKTLNIKIFKQDGIGKGNAVRKGFEKAKGDVLMILDADISVAPETLPEFYYLIESGEAEFVNGVRLVYPMEDKAMRFFNLLGNKFFSLAFSWLLGQTIRDTLCGTKVLLKKDYELIKKNRKFFGEFDPFGDFDLLFGASKLNLKIVELPIRYFSRSYGDTNISRWRHGFLLLKMVWFAARRIKFI